MPVAAGRPVYRGEFFYEGALLARSFIFSPPLLRRTAHRNSAKAKGISDRASFCCLPAMTYSSKDGGFRRHAAFLVYFIAQQMFLRRVMRNVAAITDGRHAV